ncbi:Fic family protein [Mycoplasmopsis iners]|uniref:Fic family protein n=1 Tax=Mycoplasmopsis iners TaxID=76630 RepID=UPI000495F93D|nr:Fic family protein [Mycoplasmopsis iners]
MDKEKPIKEVVLKLTYHSCAIENNTIPYEITKKLLNNQDLNNIYNAYSIREINELINFNNVIEYIANNYQDLDINNETILKLHSLIMENIIFNNGIFRNHNVTISCAYVKPYDYNVIEYKLNKLNTEFDNEIMFLKSTISKEKLVLRYHALFERIHPFSDGNGRTGRALIFLMQLKYNLPIKYIAVEHKKEYFNSLNEFLINDKIDCLYDVYNKSKGKIKWQANNKNSLS